MKYFVCKTLTKLCIRPTGWLTAKSDETGIEMEMKMKMEMLDCSTDTGTQILLCWVTASWHYSHCIWPVSKCFLPGKECPCWRRKKFQTVTRLAILYWPKTVKPLARLPKYHISTFVWPKLQLQLGNISHMATSLWLFHCATMPPVPHNETLLIENGICTCFLGACLPFSRQQTATLSLKWNCQQTAPIL